MAPTAMPKLDTLAGTELIPRTALEVRLWLEKHGLSLYEDRFARNHICGDELLNCSDEDLKELGITNVSDRLNLLTEIFRLLLRHHQMPVKIEPAIPQEQPIQDHTDYGALLSDVGMAVEQDELDPYLLNNTQSAKNVRSQRAETASASSEIINTTASGPKNAGLKRSSRLKKYFGQRPPSELIAANLPEYFPVQEERVLRQTVRNSVRYSQALNRKLVSSMISADGESESRENRLSVLSNNGESVGQILLRRKSMNRFSMLRPMAVSETVAEEDDWAEEQHLSARLQRQRLDESEFDELKKSGPQGMLLQRARQREISGDDRVKKSNEDDGQEGMKKDSVTNKVVRDECNETVVKFSDRAGKAKPLRWQKVQNERIQWLRGAMIGSGSFGDVYLGMNSLSGELMAVKTVAAPAILHHSNAGDNTAWNERKTSMVTALQHEIELLRDLEHENIVQYIGTQMEDEQLCIFLEYVPGGSVSTLLSTYGAFEEPLIQTFIRQTLTGLNYLHERGIIHRDIKGANVLVDNKGVIKISDFGISKKLDPSLLTVATTESNSEERTGTATATKAARPNRFSMQGSIFWIAPEVIKQTAHTSKSDIWSVGCLVIEMLTAQHPFADLNQIQAIFKIGNMTAPAMPSTVSPEAADFLCKSLELDFGRRQTAAELLKHPFVQQSANLDDDDSNSDSNDDMTDYNDILQGKS